MRDLFLLFFCAAIGFVAAGITSSFYKLLTLQPPRFALLGEGWYGAAVTLVFCALSGPAIMADLTIQAWLAKRDAFAVLFGGLLIVSLWSACSGVIMLELIFTIGGPPA
jgi:hypothetical protein